MKMEDKQSTNLSYEAAFEELSAILEQLENGLADMDRLAAQVARANELLDYCKTRLRNVEQLLDAGAMPKPNGP
jgi:exodeoxyribonuclease VII small subunit